MTWWEWSSAPLGLGALTARFWKPTNFVLGLLTAFGAGALLSAVTIDIVAPSVELGDFGWLAVGAVIGGLVFEGLNRTINARGGFLRKASTSITFLRDREQRRRRRILEGLERIDVFDGLPDRELDAIAKAFRTVRLDPGEALYRHGDPCEHLNVLATGEVSLTTPDGTVVLHPFEAFGHQAFVSGLQHRSSASAVDDSEVLRLSRSRLRSVLGSCPTFSDRLSARVRSEELVGYLREHHPEISEADIASWIETVDNEGMERLLPLGRVHRGNADRANHRSSRRRRALQGSAPGHAGGGCEGDVPRGARGGVRVLPAGRAGERLYVIFDGDVSLIDASGESERTCCCKRVRNSACFRS